MKSSVELNTLLALAAVAWSDGRMDPAEAQGLRNAMDQLALDAADRAAVEAALVRPVTLDLVETVRMDRLARLFTYAVANLIAKIDGELTPEEQRCLHVLGDRLGLSSLARNRAEAALELLNGRGNAQPSYELGALRRQLSFGLSQIGSE
jgi:tellurite resistance protein